MTRKSDKLFRAMISTPSTMRPDIWPNSLAAFVEKLERLSDQSLADPVACDRVRRTHGDGGACIAKKAFERLQRSGMKR